MSANFSVLAVDEESGLAVDSDDDMLFPLAHAATPPSQRRRSGSGASGSGGSASGGGASSKTRSRLPKHRQVVEPAFESAEYDVLALHADLDEELGARGAEEEPLMMSSSSSRRRGKAARSVPMDIRPRRSAQRQTHHDSDDESAAPRGPSISPITTPDAGGTSSHRRRAKRQPPSSHGAGASSSSSLTGRSPAGSGGHSASQRSARQSGSGSFSPTELGLGAIASVRGFVPGDGTQSVRGFAPPLSSSAPVAQIGSSPSGAAGRDTEASGCNTPPAQLGTSAESTRSAGGSGGRSSGGRKNKSPAECAERAVSQVLWDPHFESVRAEVTVVWSRTERVETRASGAAAWSQRLKLVPSETRLVQFVKAGASYHDTVCGLALPHPPSPSFTAPPSPPPVPAGSAVPSGL